MKKLKSGTGKLASLIAIFAAVSMMTACGSAVATAQTKDEEVTAEAAGETACEAAEDS